MQNKMKITKNNGDTLSHRESPLFLFHFSKVYFFDFIF